MKSFTLFIITIIFATAVNCGCRKSQSTGADDSSKLAGTYKGIRHITGYHSDRYTGTSVYTRVDTAYYDSIVVEKGNRDTFIVTNARDPTLMYCDPIYPSNYLCTELYLGFTLACNATLTFKIAVDSITFTANGSYSGGRNTANYNEYFAGKK
ncbi:MAG: hypothetical protein V4649_10510 [Bacteroidota bacterium]